MDRLKQRELKRGLNLLDVFCISSGAMISSGLFVLPSLAFSKAGPAVFLSYILASFIALSTVFSKAELVTAMPRAGGDYFYISRSMGSVAGMIGGLSSWFSLTLKSAFALIGMAAYLELMITPLGDIKIIAMLLCVIFVALNLIGIRQAAKTQAILVIALLGILLLYIFLGFPSIRIENYTPFLPFGIMPVFATAGMVFISYGGLTKIASVAEEIKSPARNIPLGMILSLVIIGLLYALVVFVTTGLLSAEFLTKSLTPISDAAKNSLGVAIQLLMSLAAILAFISTANAGIISASRYPLAMSRDRLLPKFFKRVNKRFSTPHYAIIFTGLFMAISIWILELESLVKLASELLLLLYIFTNFSVIIMRESRIQNYRPKFYSPLYPGMQILGILGCGFLLAEMGRIMLFLSTILIFTGLVWYLAYVGAKQIKEFALIHVIERIINRELTSGQLPKELKTIIQERDEIIEDRFDRLIKEGLVLDMEGPLSKEEFFEKVSEVLAEDLLLPKKNLERLFLLREANSSTVIRPGLAIPHILIEGRHKFSILLARIKKGVVFSPKITPVYIAFVLVGTRDERNFHLRALAAIAQTVQERNFDKKWLNARNEQELKDLVLLAERRRYLKE